MDDKNTPVILMYSFFFIVLELLKIMKTKIYMTEKSTN